MYKLPGAKDLNFMILYKVKLIMNNKQKKIMIKIFQLSKNFSNHKIMNKTF